MLKISTKGQYALLLMTDLAEQDPSKPDLLSVCAEITAATGSQKLQTNTQLEKFCGQWKAI